MTETKCLDLYSAAKLLPERDAFGNKGTFGKALIIGGSRNMVGCCVLACEGALRSGVGIACVAFPDCLYQSLTSRLTENLFMPLPTDEQGMISKASVDYLLEVSGSYQSVLIGCGMGVSDNTKVIVKRFVEECRAPLILDADALNCLCSFKDSLRKNGGNILLTPHPGEMSRLCECSTQDIQANREQTVRKFVENYNVNLLLKGHGTLICNSSGTELYVNKTGNTGLSKGGSGDLLSGIIAGLCATMKGDLFNSAVLGAFVHGLSADLLRTEFSEISMLPSDCAKGLNRAFMMLEECISEVF